jgi:hypothetical protein
MLASNSLNGISRRSILTAILGQTSEVDQKLMKTRTLIVGYVLALALFLFGQRHPGSPSPTGFHSVVDLTHSIDTPQLRTVASADKEYFIRNASLAEVSTRIDAPAHFARGLWTVDQIPAERLIAPWLC